ncbi:RepA / Rep+ protein KID [Moorella sp. E306M]|nr:RepA / Rep+ protein KID [Moorella sp. E306M]
MPEESLREIAATNEPPRTLASPEFFFLLQRLDRLDEKLTKEIRDGDQKSEERISAVEQKLSQRIDAVEQKLSQRIDAVEQKLSQRIDTVEQKLSQRIETVEQKLSQRIDTLDDKLGNLRFWAISAVITIAVGFIGTIATLLYK